MQVIVKPNKLVRLETDGVPSDGKIFAGEGDLIEVSDKYGQRLVKLGMVEKDTKGGRKATAKAQEPSETPEEKTAREVSEAADAKIAAQRAADSDKK